jgi:membrane-bound lytic murein transglycosylase MltF
MKRVYVYSIIALMSVTILATCGCILARRCQPTLYEPAIKDIEYTYLPKYVVLSDYDKYFRDAADITGYDWTLIAAIAYTESRFDSTAISAAGACGVMQVMPNTLRGFNIPDSMHMNPKTNIMAATELLRALDKRFRYIRNTKERINFVLASYNAGYGHIRDAMRLARKHGYNRHVWKGNVDSFLIKKSLPEYYNDSICRNGEFKDWRQTLSFVNKVKRNWERFYGLQQAYSDSINTVLATDTLKRLEQ